MGIRRSRLAALITALVAMLAPASATARTVFRPRIGRAMGLVPARGRSATDRNQRRSATDRNPLIIPVVYHGGPVMGGTVTVHTIFWAPPGYRFDGSPGGGVPGYEDLVKQFFSDVAHDSGTTSNEFSVLDQYGDGSGEGGYRIAYDASVDSVDATDPYPAAADQCPSPAGTATCITDAQLDRELRGVVRAHDPSGGGLHDLWEVFLPPGVDECITLDSCGTNAFGGYHSLVSDGARAPIVYAVMIDPLIEQPTPPGSDPQGNPEAEVALDTAAHETVEAITDPEGVGWMDPDGYEVADKCEFGPQQGEPLGYAPDGSPYNQLINGHQYDLQEMWSNATTGCVQSSAATGDGLPLPSVDLRQFSPWVSGDSARHLAGLSVEVDLVRAGKLVARATGRTAASGRWGALELRGPGRVPFGVGDDRDQLIVLYGRGGPPPETIATGSGGDPFTEAGWTSWLDLDTGFDVERHSVTVFPCAQTGVLSITVSGHRAPSPLPLCHNDDDAATVPTATITRSSQVVLASADNRASSIFAPEGAQVQMSLTLGEPGAGFGAPSLGAGSLPACAAELRLQRVVCDNLLPGRRYRLTRRRGGVSRSGRADGDGEATFEHFASGRSAPARASAVGVQGGDVFALLGDRRTLSVLHVSHLRAALSGNQTVLSGGRCEPGEYWGAPLVRLPHSAAVGMPGATGAGIVCPPSGRARGLPAAVIAQTDDRSGGLTRTSVPLLAGEAPGNDAIVTGSFTAVAQTAVPGPHGSMPGTGAAVGLTVNAGTRRILHAADVTRGVRVPPLVPGVYHATWVVHDIVGDTRTVRTEFVVSG